MHRFDYSEILGDIPSDIVNLVNSINRIRFLDGIRSSQYSEEYSHVEGIAKLASVKYSNAIEGIFASDKRIEELILCDGRPITHSEIEISGYGDALNSVHTRYAEMRFSKDTVISLHSAMRTKESDLRSYKTRDNAIVALLPDGRRTIAFEPVSASETEEHMKQLFLAYEELSTQGYDPLLYIPCIILDYLCIHPFLDGNGRTSRLITMMLLYKEGINVCRYISMDEHIAATKSDYYDALTESSHGWKENDWTYFPFIRYFLRMLLECYIDLDTRFALVNGKKLGKADRIENIILDSLTPMSKRQICMILPDVSIYTVEKVIKTLMSEGKIEKIGSNRSARYVRKDGA